MHVTDWSKGDVMERKGIHKDRIIRVGYIWREEVYDWEERRNEVRTDYRSGESVERGRNREGREEGNGLGEDRIEGVRIKILVTKRKEKNDGKRL